MSSGPASIVPVPAQRITLDTTLATLYAQTVDPQERVILVASYPDGGYHSQQRFIYHDCDGLDCMPASPVGQMSLKRARHEKILQTLGAQKFSLCAGAMSVIAFDVRTDSDAEANMVSETRSAVNENLELLHPAQRPQVRFFGRQSEVVIDDPQAKLAVRLPLDALYGCEHVIDPDVHYELLSKRGLALSGLTTPASELIDLGLVDYIQGNLRTGSTSQQSLPGHLLPVTAVQDWMVSTIERIKTHPLPFVLKMQQTVFGKGTFIIRTNEDRDRLLARLPATLKFNLLCTNESNLHLQTATIVLTEYISNTLSDNTSFALTFFLNRDGTHIFICCVEQKFTEKNHWTGASISYLEQSRHEQHFSKSIRDVARFLSDRGYYGAVGIDIVEDGLGKQWVVDLNVRPPGSLILGLLKGLLSVQRQLHEARLISSMKLVVDKDEFMQTLSKEIAERRIIMIAWLEDKVVGGGWTSLIVSGETKCALDDLAAKVDVMC